MRKQLVIPTPIEIAQLCELRPQMNSVFRDTEWLAELYWAAMAGERCGGISLDLRAALHGARQPMPGELIC